jgi:hypothetical protein
VQVGFVVPSARYNAVRRNRIKRLLREAYAYEQRSLSDVLTREHKRISLIFSFKGNTADDVRRLKLRIVREEVTVLCRSLLVELKSKEQCQAL